MKIASWNINSLRVRLPQVLAWLTQHQPDILGLQEIKISDSEFPYAPFEEIGYIISWSALRFWPGANPAESTSCRENWNGPPTMHPFWWNSESETACCCHLAGPRIHQKHENIQTIPSRRPYSKSKYLLVYFVSFVSFVDNRHF